MGFVQNRIVFIFHIVHPVPHGQALSLHLVPAAVFLTRPDHTRIHEQLSAVRQGQGASGEAPVPVIGLVRRKRRGKVFPVQQVTAHRMSPVHGPPLGLIGIVLIK